MLLDVLWSYVIVEAREVCRLDVERAFHLGLLQHLPIIALRVECFRSISESVQQRALVLPDPERLRLQFLS